jgi:hypothetical protein
LTAESSARWASAIIAGNDAQYRLARDVQRRHIIGLRAAIASIEKRLAQPTADTLTPEQRTACRKAKLPKGYATQAERFAKQRRLQMLLAKLARVTADRDNRVVHVVQGGKRLAKRRNNLDVAKLTPTGWREEWDCARDRIETLGSGDEPFGNLTLTVTPDGEVSLRLPKPMEHLANARHGRYVLTGKAVFSYRTEEWRGRITGGKPVSYTITRTPRRAGRYLTATWACPPTTVDVSMLADPGPQGSVERSGGRGGPQRRAPRRAAPRSARQPNRPTTAHRAQPSGVIGTSGCSSPPRDHSAHPLHREAPNQRRRGGRSRLRRCPGGGPGDNG